VYKITHELERIADIADGIANYVNNLNTPFPKQAIKEILIKEMFAQTQAMMDNVIEAFEKEDTKIARRVFKQDELLNSINSNASTVIISNYEESSAESLFYLLSCVRKLERAGDLTKNIAEELIFSIESKVIKHRKNRK
jgi:phosphate transport system protein